MGGLGRSGVGGSGKESISFLKHFLTLGGGSSYRNLPYGVSGVDMASNSASNFA